MSTFGFLGSAEEKHHQRGAQSARDLTLGIAKWRTLKPGRTKNEVGVRLAVTAGRVLAHIDSQQDPDLTLQTHVRAVIDELTEG